MADDFSPLGGNGKASLTAWAGVTNPSGAFMPFPATTQTSTEVGYDEGGYGDSGYDTPSISASVASSANWASFTNK